MGFSFLVNSPGYHFSQLELRPSDGTQAHRSALVTAFMFLQIFGGHFGVPLIILTVLLSKKVQRHPMLLNFCAGWFIYTTSFTLLLYAGKQFGPEPPIQLCIVQSAFIYGTPVMTSSAGLAFVLHLWFSLHSGHGDVGSKAERWRFILLLACPYILFFTFVTGMAVLASRNPETVSRSRALFYCSIDLPIVNIVPGTSAFTMVAVVVFEILIGVKLYRHNKAFKSLAHANNGPPMHIFARVGIFSGYSLLALIACVAFWSSSGDDLPYIIQASLPTAAFLIFGSQDDLLRVWGVTAAATFVYRLFARK
ncbi:hypothetical protein DFH07DRAFT_796022 [Mycena maculata]|uniref:Uncharacterized protein n=1 Tax=Mycena maculata TaxID=230809 RepID=A0AAD7NX53_9AGAR|nr:hypothetical protein DFH07DRAFT_796022 [Mycena maculata]